MLMCCRFLRTGWQGFVSEKMHNLDRMDIKTILPKVTNVILAGMIVIEFMLNTSDSFTVLLCVFVP